MGAPAIPTLLLLTMAGCAPFSHTIISGCEIFGPLTYSDAATSVGYVNAMNADDPGNRLDTLQTVNEIKRHNAKWEEACK